MKHLKITLFLLLICTAAQAQANLDSLWTVWSNERLHDTIRLEAINKYINQNHLTEKPDSTIPKVMLMLDFAEKTNNKKYKAESYKRLGAIQMKWHYYAESVKTYSQAITLFEEHGDTISAAGCLWNLGLVYHMMGQYSNSLNCYAKGLAIYEEYELADGASGILNNIGLIYKIQKNYTKALEYYIKSAQIAIQAGGSNDVAESNIGGIYLKQGEYNKALTIFKEVLKKREKEKDTDKYHNTGMSSVYRNIADVYTELGNYDLALSSYMLSLEYAYNDSLSVGTKYIETDIGLFYERFGKAKPAIEWCNKGLTRAKNEKHLRLEQLSCECLYKAYKMLGDKSSALENYEQFNVLKDSLKLEETAKSLQQMEFAKQILADSLQQEDENLRTEIAHQKEVIKKDKIRNVYIGSGLFFLLLAVSLYYRNRYIQKAKASIEKEKDRSESLLLNILPAEIAEELKEKGKAEARDIDMVSILFTDFKEFTQTSEKLSAQELVAEINSCFEAFDAICGKYGIEKIKTIGDAYMAAGGLPVPTDDSVNNTVLGALEMQEFIYQKQIENKKQNKPAFEMRVGIHTGPVVAGIVGVKKFQYDIWGDTVNTASRMESSGEVGKVNISQSTYELIKNDPQFIFETRGKITAKGKGEIEMYFVAKVSS